MCTGARYEGLPKGTVGWRFKVSLEGSLQGCKMLKNPSSCMCGIPILYVFYVGHLMV